MSKSSEKSPLLFGDQRPPLVHPPLHFPARDLERLLRDARTTRFSAVPMPVGTRLLIGNSSIPIAGYMVVATYGLRQLAVALGLSEDDAQERARLLNQPTAPSGAHLWN